MEISGVGSIYNYNYSMQTKRSHGADGQGNDESLSFAAQVTSVGDRISGGGARNADSETLIPLGIGFANAGQMGYGMSASLVSSDASDDVIVRVKIAKGQKSSEMIDVNLSEFDPENATAVEMFAYCQYRDSIGEGSDHKWGSWNVMKSIISPTDGMDFGSLDNIMNEKRNWTKALTDSKAALKDLNTGDTISASDLLRIFKEQNKLTAEELKDEDDWRSMSDDVWDEMLSEIDDDIDAYKEDIRERVKKELEAAQKAASEAAPEMKSTAAQEATLSVAASGFYGANESDGETSTEAGDEDAGVDHETNWTRRLHTDDQTILRSAAMAQAMERMAESRLVNVEPFMTSYHPFITSMLGDS